MSSKINFIFYYIKGYIFRPYKQVIIRPTSNLSPQMLYLMGSQLVHIRKKHKITYTIQLKRVREVFSGGFISNIMRAN